MNWMSLGKAVKIFKTPAKLKKKIKWNLRSNIILYIISTLAALFNWGFSFNIFIMAFLKEMYSTSTYIIKDACWCLFVSTIHLGKHFTHSISWSIVNLDLTCFLIMYIIESLTSVWCFSLTSYLISFLRYPNNYIFIFKIHTFTGKCFSFNQIYFIFLEAWYGLNISFPISEMCLWIILYNTFQFPFCYSWLLNAYWHISLFITYSLFNSPI